MKQQTILFTLESFFPDHRAGTEVYVLNLCRYFLAKDWCVAVLIPTHSEQGDYSYEGIAVHTFPIPEKPDSKELNGLIPPRGIEGFNDKVKRIKPHVVHFHSFGRAINGFHLKSTKELGYKTMFTPHLGNLFCIEGNMHLFEKPNFDGRIIESRCLSYLLQSKGYNNLVSNVIGAIISMLIKIKPIRSVMAPAWQQARHRKQELQRISKYADLTFAIAPWIQKAFEANTIDNSILIPQGISPVFLENVKHHELETPSEINFVYVGRMHPIKGFHFLKQAWDNLKTKKHKLHIITNPSGGEDDYFNTFKAWANQDSSIIWNERFSQKEVAVYLDTMDVLILPSIAEVAPLVILEAATRRIPVIASDYTAMKDMIAPNVNGLLFKNGDWEDLLTQLKKMSDNPQLISELGKNIETPATMTHVAELIEYEVLKLVSHS